VLTNRVGQQVMLDLRNRLYRHLQDLSLSFFTSARTGELQSRITSDVAGVQTVLSPTASKVVADVVTLTSALVAMLILSVPLTGVALLTVPLFAVAARVVGAPPHGHGCDAARDSRVVVDHSGDAVGVGGGPRQIVRTSAPGDLPF